MSCTHTCARTRRHLLAARLHVVAVHCTRPYASLCLYARCLLAYVRAFVRGGSLDLHHSQGEHEIHGKHTGVVCTSTFSQVGSMQIQGSRLFSETRGSLSLPAHPSPQTSNIVCIVISEGRPSRRLSHVAAVHCKRPYASLCLCVSPL